MRSLSLAPGAGHRGRETPIERHGLRPAFAGVVLVLSVLAACAVQAPIPTAPTLPAARPSASPPPTVYHSPTVAPSPTAEPTLDLVAVAAESQRLMDAQAYGDVIALWNDYLQHDPEYGDGYYQRGTARIWGVSDTGSLDIYLRNKIAGLRDMDRAAELGPVVDGRVYFRRYQALTDLMAVEPLRVNQASLLETALQNLTIGNAIGPWSNVSQGLEVADLSLLGQCDEALYLGRHLLNQLSTFGPKEPGVLAIAHRNIALAHTCDGRFAQAVAEYDQALALDPDVDHWSWELARSMNLYLLGRSEEALEFLDRDIAEHPYYSGERYFMRALILYDTGRTEEALSDLDFGVRQTWMPTGLEPYVRGRIAIDSGDGVGGLEFLRDAEVTMPLDYAFFLDRIRRDILSVEERLRATQPAAPTASTPNPTATPTSPGTPIPTLTPSPTPRFPVLVGTQGYADAHVVDLNQGTGPLLIRPEQSFVSSFVYAYRFQPATAIPSSSAVDVTYRLVPFEDHEDIPSLEVEFLDGEYGFIRGTNYWGDNRLRDLRAVGRGGEVTMTIRNTGVLPVYLKDLGMRVVSSPSEGRYLAQGFGQVPFFEAQLVPPPERTFDLSERTGPITIPSGNGPILRFSPREPVDYAVAQTLEVIVEPEDGRTDLRLRIVPWGAWSRGWFTSEMTSPGIYVVREAAEMVDAQGSVVLGFINDGSEPLELASISARVALLLENGSKLVLGPDM